VRIYTASAFVNYERVRAFNEDLRHAGHEVTHDWTTTGEFDASGHPTHNIEADKTPEARQLYAELDRDGVLGAELVVCLFDEGRPFGGLIEFGGAALHGVECWVLRPKEWNTDVKLSIFYDLPNVEVFEREQEIRSRLDMALRVINVDRLAA
jgi:hypothetical protein